MSPRPLPRRKNPSSASLPFQQLESRLLLAGDWNGVEQVPGELLIQYTSTATPFQQAQARIAVAAELAETIHTAAMKNSGTGVLQRVKLPQEANLPAAMEALRRQPGVVFVEPNIIFNTAATSNDPYYTNGSLWGTYGDDLPNPIGPSGTTNTYGSHVEKGWAEGITGSADVIVGIVDTGVQVLHPDLAANIWVNPYEIAGDGIDNDGNGYVDDVRGWDFYNNDNSVYDDPSIDAHGTHVAGTIGAVGNNSTGIAGVNWTVRMVPVKFLAPSGSLANAVRAVDYLTDLKTRHGINLVVSNHSWGATGSGSYSQALHEAVIRHAKADIIFVAAAMNNATNNDITEVYPANFNTTQGTSNQTPAPYDAVISVANLMSDGGLNPSSGYGLTSVDLAGPGTTIWSTVPNNSYAAFDGTSMATPHVAGAVALLVSAQAEPLTPVELRDAILGSTTTTSSLAGKTVTGGRLNIYNALNTAPDETPPIISGVSAVPGSLSATINWTTDEAATTEVLYGTSPDSLDQTYSGSSLVMTHSASLTGLSALTTYYFRARSRDAAGNTSTTEVQSFTTLAVAPILFVDDDLGETYERFFTAALAAGGFSFDIWNVASNGSTPSSAELSNYDLVIWNTGSVYSGPGAGLASGEQSAIANYLDGGGRIFISGQDVLYSGVTSSFRQNYLKVASHSDDVRRTAHTAAGVSGHPVSNGMNLPISNPADFPQLYIDAVTPVAGAMGMLNHGMSGTTSPYSAVSYRGDLSAGGFGIVFTTTPFEAISNSASNPNNQNTFIARVVNYLLPKATVSTPTPSSNTSETGVAVDFTVTLNTAPTANVVIPVSSSDTTEGTVNVSSLIFTPANWSTPQTVTVTGVDDAIFDDNQPYTVLLGSATSTDVAFHGLNPSDVNLVNLDDDTVPGISVSGPETISEGNNGTNAVTFTVSLSSVSPVTVSVDYATSTSGFSSAATPEGDFSPVIGRLDFAPGQTSKTVSVLVRGERLVELDETFALLLSNPVQGVLTDDLAEVTITADDSWDYPQEIDFGTELSPIKAGAVGVGVLPYSSSMELGWTNGIENVQVVDREIGVPALRDVALTRDSSFRFDVPNGQYFVRVTYGDAAKAHDQMRVFVEGAAKPLVSTAANQFLTRAYVVDVTDGQLDLRFLDVGGSDPDVAIAGIGFSRR